MLVAAISDTHLPRGARRLPEACVEQLRSADLILHGGDLCAVSVLAELELLGPPVRAVYGNADEPALRARLPAHLVVEAGSVRIGLVHVPGPRAGREERLAARFPDCEAVLYGHTHLPQVERRRVGDGRDVWLLNPGSPTERRQAPFHSMLLLRIGPGGVGRGGEVEPELVRLS